LRPSEKVQQRKNNTYELDSYLPGGTFGPCFDFRKLLINSKAVRQAATKVIKQSIAGFLENFPIKYLRLFATIAHLERNQRLSSSVKYETKTNAI